MSRQPATLPFVKMHGIGNDYVFVNVFEHEVPDPPELARNISDRHFGVGSDGLILIGPSETADLRMWIFNADGSEAEMCGNGIRCVAKFAYDHGLARKSPISIQTEAGVKTIEVEIRDGKVASATVNMGAPNLTRGSIPMPGAPDENALDVPLRVGNETFRVTALSLGNPHCVIFIEEPVAAFPLEIVGPLIERHPSFPHRINVHIVNCLSMNEIRMRTWERGSGITMACGTGASAVCVAGAITERTGRSILAHLPGGDLRLEWRADGVVMMSGPATEVFSGEWPLH